MSQSQKLHTCVLCNSQLESKEALQTHFRKHANKEIDLKGRPIGPGGELKQTSSGGVYIKGSGSAINTNIVCDVCGEAFSCNTKAIQHKFRKHPFHAAKHYCPQCGMQFPLQGHRDKHLKEMHESDHVPRNPYPCYQCGAVFYNKAAHEYHDKSAHHRVVTLHKQILTPPPSKKIRYNNAGEPQSVYYCHLCGVEYIVKFNLQKHLERQHPPAERNVQPTELFKCNTCDALFYNAKAYHNHNIYHRPDDLYVTSEEQRLQTVTRVDQDFDIRRVQPAAERYIPKYRRRRTVIPPPKLNLQATKKNESDEEMSPPPNSDSDSDTEPPQKRAVNDEQNSRSASNNDPTNMSDSDKAKLNNKNLSPVAKLATSGPETSKGPNNQAAVSNKSYANKHKTIEDKNNLENLTKNDLDNNSNSCTNDVSLQNSMACDKDIKNSFLSALSSCGQDDVNLPSVTSPSVPVAVSASLVGSSLDACGPTEEAVLQEL